MREIAQPLYKKIRARLYLNAVLPTFEDLLSHSEAAREIIKRRHFSISFQTTSGLKSSLSFHKGQCFFKKTNAETSDIALLFLTEEHLNKEFEKKGFRLPIPIRGSTRVKSIKAFKKLAVILEDYLRPSEISLKDPEVHRVHVEMQLSIALRATIELATHEKLSHAIMKNTPSGIAHFVIGGDDGYSAWLKWEDSVLSSGKGHPERDADVTVTFKDADTALKAVGNRIDVMAAIGQGEIKVAGLVPLADSLGYIFERIPLYITP